MKYIFFLVLWLLSSNLFALCRVEKINQNDFVLTSNIKVLDGDTIRVQNQNFRVIGLNTPELNIGKPQTAEPLAFKAKQALEAIVLQNSRIYLLYDQSQKDKYGRILAHLVDQKKRLISSLLIAQGLATHIQVGNNQLMSECLHQIEKQARKQNLGLWQEDFFYIQASKISKKTLGFKIVAGRITKIDYTRSHIWLELDNNLAIKVNLALKNIFPKIGTIGKIIKLKGWVINRGRQKNKKFKSYMLTLNNLNMIVSYE